MCIPLALAAGLAQGAAAVAQGVSDNNIGKAQQRIAEYEGRQALDAANFEASQIRREGRKVEGANRVALAANGVDMGSASALEIAMQNARDNELDALFAINKGQKVQYAKKTEGEQARYAGKMTLINSGLKAVGVVGQSAAQAFPKTFGAG